MAKMPCMHRALGLSLLVVAAFSLLAMTIGKAHSNPDGKSAGKKPGSGKVVLYAAVGPEFTRYEVDLESATLVKRESITLPANVQEVALHPSKRYLYVAWSNGGPSSLPPNSPAPAGSQHGLTAFRIDPGTGSLLPHGKPISLPSRPIHVTTDVPGTHVLTAYNNPSGVTVHRIEPDGTIGSQVKEPDSLDVGVYAHQVRVEPSNEMVIFMTRGNGPTPTKAEDPGAIKLFTYKDGLLANRGSIAPGGGFNFQVRHLDFHPTQPWVFVSLERQDKLEVYEMLKDGTLNNEPSFTKSTLGTPAMFGQVRNWGPSTRIRMADLCTWPIERGGTTESEGKPVFVGGENSIAVFSINQDTGEPTLIQNADTRGIHTRTFALDPSGKILVAGNMMELPVRGKDGIKTVPASLAIFRVRSDGKLDYVRKYDLNVGDRNMFWMGMIPLP